MSELSEGIGTCQTLSITTVDEYWFAENREAREAAIAMCQRCPLIQACLTQATKDDVRWGVFGGKDFTRRYTSKYARRAEAA